MFFDCISSRQINVDRHETHHPQRRHRARDRGRRRRRDKRILHGHGDVRRQCLHRRISRSHGRIDGDSQRGRRERRHMGCCGPVREGPRSLTNVTPGDYGTNVIDLTATDVDAWGRVRLARSADADVTCTEPEKVVDVGCATDADGELDDVVRVWLWNDADDDGVGPRRGGCAGAGHPRIPRYRTDVESLRCQRLRRYRWCDDRRRNTYDWDGVVCRYPERHDRRRSRIL